MAKPIYKLNNQIVHPPESGKGARLKIQLNFDRDKDRIRDEGGQQLNVKNLAWVREENDIILAYKQAGINGTGPGLTEGILLDIALPVPGALPIDVLNGYVDLTSGTKFSDRIRTQADIKERDSVDHMNDIWDNVTFEYLFKVSGEISTNDFISIPYILNSVPDYPQTMLSLLSIYVVTQQIKDSIEGLTELAAEMANPFEATSIVRAVFRVAYLIALIVTLIKLVKDTIQLIIQPVKYHCGMTLLSQLQKGAQHLGWTFRCPILETGTTEGIPNSKLVILPQKPQVLPNDIDDRILGITTPTPNSQQGFFKGTVGDLFRAAKKLFKGKFVFLPGQTGMEMWLVREDENASSPTYQLPNLRRDYYNTNMDEFRANYTIGFEVDSIEKNTIQQYKGTVFSVVAKPAISGPGPKLMRGVEDVRIPFALAKRKETLTVPEKVIKELLDVLDTIINALIEAVNAVINVYNEVVKVLNKIIDALEFVGIDVGFDVPSIPTIPPVNLGGIIENRIGMLMLEIDQTAVPKIFFLDQANNPKFTKITATNATALTAKSLYRGYHFIQSFHPSVAKPNGNQWSKESFKNVPFSVYDYMAVKLNNKCFDFQGNEAEIDSCEFDPEGQHADLEVRFSEKIGINLIESEIEPDGK